MLVKFNGVWLTNDGSGNFPERAITSTQEATLNGKEIVQEVDFARGLASFFYDRGNLSHTFTFRVARNFQLLMPDASNPIAQATSFMMTHFTLLPKSGVLLLQCGGWGEDAIVVQANNAVLESTPKCSSRGVAVDMTYTLRCGPLQVVAVDVPGPNAAAALTDPQGNPLTDPSGNVITNP